MRRDNAARDGLLLSSTMQKILRKCTAKGSVLAAIRAGELTLRLIWPRSGPHGHSPCNLVLASCGYITDARIIRTCFRSPNTLIRG